MKITIDTDEVKKLTTDSKNILLSPEAENSILALLDIQEQIELAIDEAKKSIEEEALKLNPNFSSVKSDKVKVFYRAYGARFLIDESKLEQLPVDFYTKVTKISANTKAIEKYEKENETVPDGVIETERKKSISISKIGAKDE